MSNEQFSLNQYKQEATQRYDEFVEWMVAHWPQRSDPLSSNDFMAGKRELGLLLGAKLYAGHDHADSSFTDENEANQDQNDNQYQPVTPAPWP